jgi:hypothetical protein
LDERDRLPLLGQLQRCQGVAALGDCDQPAGLNLLSVTFIPAPGGTVKAFTSPDDATPINAPPAINRHLAIVFEKTLRYGAPGPRAVIADGL